MSTIAQMIERSSKTEDAAADITNLAVPVTRLSRRSSISRSNSRRSRSMASIPFESQLGAIDSDLPLHERLHRLTSVCIMATCELIRTTQMDDELMTDVGRKLRLMPEPLWTPEDLDADKVTAAMEAIILSASSSLTSKDLESQTLSKLKNETKRLQDESVQWKSLYHERKAAYLSAESAVTAPVSLHLPDCCSRLAVRMAKQEKELAKLSVLALQRVIKRKKCLEQVNDIITSRFQEIAFCGSNGGAVPIGSNLETSLMRQTQQYEAQLDEI